MCSQCEGTKERSKAYLAYRHGVRDGRNSPTLTTQADWQAFYQHATPMYGEHLASYCKGFDEGYNA